MRTTIRLPDELYGDVRRQSLAKGVTVTTFIEQALRAALERQENIAPGRFVVIPFEGSGVQPGIDLTDSSALLDAMEG